MSFKYKLIAAAASAALAAPAVAQVVGSDAAVKADTPAAEAGVSAAAQAEAGAQVQAGAAAAASGEAQTDAAATGEAEAQAEGGAAAAAPVIAASAADLRVGAAVLDPQGGAVGTIEAVDADGAVVSTGSVRAKMPVSSFGRNAGGLVISMTRAELEAAVSARTGS